MATFLASVRTINRDREIRITRFFTERVVSHTLKGTRIFRFFFYWIVFKLRYLVEKYNLNFFHFLFTR